ncbi:MAG: NADH-quinone oxidoreductase subunit H [Anaerolineae bacterium]
MVRCKSWPDMLKMFFKEEVIPGHVDKLVYLIAPGLSLVSALIAFAVIHRFTSRLSYSLRCLEPKSSSTPDCGCQYWDFVFAGGGQLGDVWGDSGRLVEQQ